MSNINADRFLNSLDNVPEKMLVVTTISLNSGPNKVQSTDIVSHDLSKHLDACRALFDDADVTQVRVVSSVGALIWDSEVERRQMSELYSSKMRSYAGIGSHETPDEVLDWMSNIGQFLATKGYVLRSGFADGADKAFARGAEVENGAMENFLPWPGFNGAPIGDERFIYVTDEASILKAERTAMESHPNWAACSRAARNMHTRNVYQVLGRNLDDPVDFIVCWTPRGKRGGGTGQALRIAHPLGIRIYDLALEEDQERLSQLLGSI